MKEGRQRARYLVGLLIQTTLLLFISVAQAETIPGYDAIGLARFCPRYLQAPKLPALSTLLNTFGDPLPCVEKRIAMGGLEVLQVDLIDATCWRNNKCPPGVPRPTDLKEIRRRAKTVQPIAAANPQMETWVSPALEHDVKDEKTVVAMLEAAQKGCPACKVINSPFTGATPKGYKVELHGTKTTAFSISGDGASSFDADNLSSDSNGFEHRTAGRHTTFVWFNELNLRCTGEKTFTPPLARTEKPTADLFEQAAAIMQPEQPQPPAPAACKSVRRPTQKEIYKPNAESYCNGAPEDPRGNKPLLIIKRPGKPGERLKILSPQGQEVGCFKYFGSFSDIPGTFRYYVGDCSGQTPAKLKRDLGNEWGFVQVGKGDCIAINSIRRMGVYR